MRMTRGIRSLWRPIWIGGLVAGTVDVGSACVIYKASPTIILQAIAGGVLGMATFDKGWWSVSLGLALQWVMSIMIASCCVLASSRYAALARRWIVAGCLYGVVTFLVMYYVVVPLSASRTRAHFSTPWLIKNILANLLFGVIISAAARWNSRTPKV
jgi:uncharacterized membrane protein YagU involved in acid resistance